MAVLEKIRVKLGILIAILVAVALLSFILDPQTLRSAISMLSSDNKVGEMAGESISYKDFYEEYDNYQKIAEITGQQVNDEANQSAIRDAAWQSIFDNKVFIPKANKAGIFVGDQELLDLTQGNNISPVLAQQAMFLDRNGNFSRENLASFVQSIDTDQTGQAAKFWNFLEESVVRTQYYSKYLSLIDKSAIQTNIEKERVIADNNAMSEVDYVFSPMPFEKDSTIQVSSNDIRDFYNKHKKDMRQPANRDIEYVMFEVVPSADDKEATEEAFNELYEEFKTAENLKNFIALNSDGKWDPLYYDEKQLEAVPEFKDFAFGGSKDVASPVHAEENSFSAIRVADVRAMADSAHVYYKAFALTDEASAEEFLAAQKKKVAVEDFTELGWVSQEGLYTNGLSDFIPVLYSADKLTKVKSVNSQAIFVLYTPDRSKAVKKVQLATLLKNVLPSEDTYRDFQMKAAELVDASAGKYENFAAFTKEKNLPVIPVQNVTEATRRIGVVENAREVVRWIFEDKTKEGSVSDEIVVSNKYYFVTAVTKVRKEGITDINDVAPQIREMLYAQKVVEAQYDKVKKEIEGKTSLDEIAEILQTTKSHLDGVSFGSFQNMSIDPSLVGAVAAAEPGKIKMVKGAMGVYVFNVTNRENGTFFSEADAETALQRTRNYQIQTVQGAIAQEADIKDYRARFF